MPLFSRSPPIQNDVHCRSNTTLLLSTLRCLLRLTLDEKQRLTGVETLHEGQGIYYGLTYRPWEIFVVARNLDIHKRFQDPRLPDNNILIIPWPSRGQRWRSWTIDDTTDLHQICYHDELLWLVNGRHPELLAVDPDTRAKVGHAALAQLVPAELQHPTPTIHYEDRFHFNSLHFSEDRLFVLAHNWNYGSFVMEFEYLGPQRFFRGPRLLDVHKSLGRQSHNVFKEGPRLYVLDSAHGRVLTNDGHSCQLGRLELQEGYLRGLAVGRQYLYVAHGYQSDDRAGRLVSPSRLAVLDRRTLQVVSDIDVGPFGNTCDLLLMDLPGERGGVSPPWKKKEPDEDYRCSATCA